MTAVDNVDKGKNEHNFCANCLYYQGWQDYVIRKNEFFVNNQGIS